MMINTRSFLSFNFNFNFNFNYLFCLESLLSRLPVIGLPHGLRSSQISAVVATRGFILLFGSRFLFLISTFPFLLSLLSHPTQLHSLQLPKPQPASTLSMAFIGAPQPWLSPSPSSTPPPPFNAFDNTNDDCALPLCSNKCPQFCLVLPPPPPFFFNNNPSYDYDDDDDSSSNRISRLKVAFISVLSTAFLILFFVHVISILRHRRQRHNNNRLFNPNHVDSLIPDQTQPETAATSGLEITAAENSRAAGGGANTMMA